MTLLLIAAASLAVVSCASLSLEDLEFHAWKLKFGKSYRTPEEEARHKDIWLSTRLRVLTHNILADQGIKTFRMGMNHFSDMDNAEYHQKALMSPARSNKTKTAHSALRPGTMTFGHKKGLKPATSVDWRDKGCVTPVKDQQRCKSSWAFSVTGAVESQACIAHKHLVSLSEQQLIDCSVGDDCSGGTIEGGLKSLKLYNEGQLDTEDSYPYEAKGSTCRFNASTVGAVCTGYDTGDPGDEESLQCAVALLGPVSVIVDARNDSFQSYQSGVYDEPSCKSTGNLAMLVVGYGTENGKDYWLVKNSWGVNWGDKGYIKMSRNNKNQCGIASTTILPRVKCMKLLIIAAASLAVVSCASLSLEDLEFHAWKLKFGKVYRTPEEEARRKDIWLSTRLRVLAHNILADQGIKTYRMGMNHFSDMTREEHHNTVLFRSTIPSNETKATRQQGASSFRQTGGAKLPSSFDWRESGCVTAVKMQGSCGSCWAFSTTGAMESHTCIKYKRLPSLSEQQLVDCSRPYGPMGCSGGWMSNAFHYIQANGGIDTEEAYPYEGKDLPCRFKPEDVGATLTGYVNVTTGDELSLQETVATLGPVAVAIDVYKDFWSYESGVYDEPSCRDTELLHAMLVVGYGTEDGQDYWLVKNSWDSNWGENGYIKMSRNKANQCDIASYASYPQV